MPASPRRRAPAGIGLTFGLVFLFAGLCFKVSAVPFHMWTPDVYQGAPTPVTAFFAAAPKVAAIAVFMRVSISAFPGIAPQWQQIIVFVAIASMALGSFAAIGQRNIKRLMAYSSIGHMGFALVGLAAGTSEGIQGVLVYMAIYVAMTLGTFACIISMRRNGKPVEDITDLAGLARTKPADGVLPRDAAVLHGRRAAAGGLLRQVLRLPRRHQGRDVHARGARRADQRGRRYYYLMIVKVMYFDDPTPAFDPMGHALRTVLAVTGLFVLLFFVYPGPLVDAAGVAAKSLF